MGLTEIIKLLNSSCEKTEKVWNETKTVWADSGVRIGSIEYSSRSQALRIGTGITMALSPIIGLYGGPFLVNQLNHISYSKAYATHPQGRQMRKIYERDISELALAFFCEVGLNAYYISLLN